MRREGRGRPLVGGRPLIGRRRTLVGRWRRPLVRWRRRSLIGRRRATVDGEVGITDFNVQIVSNGGSGAILTVIEPTTAADAPERPPLTGAVDRVR